MYNDDGPMEYAANGYFPDADDPVAQAVTALRKRGMSEAEARALVTEFGENREAIARYLEIR